MSRAARLLLAIGLASMVTTALVVALIAPLWLLGVSVGLAGMLWAEALLFGGLIAADCLMAGFSAAFVRGGCSAVVVTCAALSFALSAGFMLMPGMPLGLFVAFQLLIAFVLVVGCAVLAFSDAVRGRAMRLLRRGWRMAQVKWPSWRRLRLRAATCGSDVAWLAWRTPCASSTGVLGFQSTRT